MTVPTVSIALCTYNGEAFLEAQLASLAAQSLQPCEIVVCDDGSSDGTLSILDRFSGEAPCPVRVYQNPANLGSTANFERAMSLCTGDYIALCDQDDVWLPEKLEILEQSLTGDPAAGYVFSDAFLVNDELQPSGKRMWDTVRFDADQQALFRTEKQVDILLNRTVVTGATMMVRRKLVSVCRPFPRFTVHDLWVALVLTAIGAYGIPVVEPLINYRLHGAQQIGVAARRSRFQQLQRGHFAERRKLLANRCQTDEQLVAKLDGFLSETAERTSLQQRYLGRSHRLAQRRVEHERRRMSLEAASLGKGLMLILGESLRGQYAKYSGGSGAVVADVLFVLLYRRRADAASPM